MLNGNVLTKDLVDTFEKKDGIYIPKAAKDFKELEVIQAEKIDKGSIVYIKKHLGTEIDVDGEKFVVIDQRDIILVK